MRLHDTTGPAPAFNLVLRKATREDIDYMLEAERRAFPDDPTNWDANEFATALDDRDYRMVVAIYCGDFAGYALCHSKPFRPWVNLNRLIVLPRYAAKGIGRALLDQATNHPQFRPLMRLYVEKRNQRAIELYRKNKFHFLGIKKKHYENNDDALVCYKLVYPIYFREWIRSRLTT